MVKYFFFVLLVIIFGFIMSCKSVSTKPSVIIGMPISDIDNKKYNIISEELVATEPGQLMKGYRVLAKDNIEYSLIFNNRNLIQKILTSDKSFHLPNGVGVNTTFAEFKKHYENYEVIILLGYGRCIKVNEDITFGFSWQTDGDNTKIHDTEKIEWIELDKIYDFEKNS